MQTVAQPVTVARLSAPRASSSRSSGPARAAQPRQALKRGQAVVPRAAGTGACASGATRVSRQLGDLGERMSSGRRSSVVGDSNAGRTLQFADTAPRALRSCDPGD